MKRAIAAVLLLASAAAAAPSAENAIVGGGYVVGGRGLRGGSPRRLPSSTEEEFWYMDSEGKSSGDAPEEYWMQVGEVAEESGPSSDAAASEDGTEGGHEGPEDGYWEELMEEEEDKGPEGAPLEYWLEVGKVDRGSGDGAEAADPGPGASIEDAAPESSRRLPSGTEEEFWEGFWEEGMNDEGKSSGGATEEYWMQVGEVAEESGSSYDAASSASESDNGFWEDGMEEDPEDAFWEELMEEEDGEGPEDAPVEYWLEVGKVDGGSGDNAEAADPGLGAPIGDAAPERDLSPEA